MPKYAKNLKDEVERAEQFSEIISELSKLDPATVRCAILSVVTFNDPNDANSCSVSTHTLGVQSDIEHLLSQINIMALRQKLLENTDIPDDARAALQELLNEAISNEPKIH